MPLLIVLVFAALAASSSIGPAGAAARPVDKVDAKVTQQIAAQGETTFWIELRQEANLSSAAGIQGRTARTTFVLDRLQTVANQSQAELRALLTQRGARFQPFYIVNAIRVTAGDAALLSEVAARPEVERIRPSESFRIPDPIPGETESRINAVEWNIADINAPQVWAQFGDRGEGIVVGSIDSGAQYTHSALVRQYRGNLGSGNFNHNYNWWDPSNVCPTEAPCDNNNHGTHTMGTMVGDDGDPGPNQIGVAPHARWITAKGCETNLCSDFALLSSAQWILAPTDLDGNNPRPDLAPDIVNNSWGGGPNNSWFLQATSAWVAAGIFPAFSNGNDGPGCGTAGSPGDYGNTYAAGAFDIGHNIAGFSSRGPSAFDGGIKPNISAPGVNVRSSVPGNTYAAFNGTSMASPHVAATVALMWSAAPALKRDIAGTRAILNQTAIDTSDLQCGGTAGNNNVWGEGRLDALAAVNASPRGPTGTLAGTVTDSGNGNPLQGVTVEISGPFDRTTTTDASGRYTQPLPVGTYDVTFSKFGFVTETSTGVQITEGATTTLNAALDPAPLVTLSGTVTDGSGHGWQLYTRIDINGRPGGPIFTNPVTGQYSLSIPAGATYSIKYTATLPGYQVVTDSVVVGSGTTVHNVAIPVLSNCTAPGYQFNVSQVFSENFNAGVMPPGWAVTDAIGNGQVWAFNDPGGRGNLTGGDGAFAIMDSDRFGIGQTQDSSLVTPTVNLSTAGGPIVRFNEDYRPFPTDAAVDVDVSIDGGTTWQNAFHDLAGRRGPRLTTVPLPQAANQANVKVRWRYRSTFGWWWEVDNAFIGNRSCDPVPGGLVVGNVFDANANTGLNGATVTSADNAADKGTSAATPDDPNNPDGYYQLFSSLTGAHPFTASKALYVSQTKTVNVVADNATRSDFSLGSGRIEASPTSITTSQVLGSTTTRTLTLRNTGTAPAEVDLSERKGSFQILTMKGSELLKLPLSKGAADPGQGLDHVNDERVQGIDAGRPNQPSWSPIALYPVAIMDNSADQIGGTVYSVGGLPSIANAYAYDPTDDTWSAIANMPAPRQKAGVGGIGGKLYVAGGWSPGGVPVAATVAYDPGTDTWQTLASNPAPRAAAGTAVVDDQLYQVGGCADGACTASNNVVRYDPASDSWASLAPYPHATSWISCGGIDGKVYCAGGLNAGTFNSDGFVYDPAADSWSPIAAMPFNLWGSAYSAANGMLIISSGLTMNTLTNQGLAYDPSADAWSPLPNAQFPRFRAGGACGFFKVGGSSIPGFNPTRESERLSELDQCGVTDVPWLAENPTTATLQPGQSVNVVVTLTATPAVQVGQPGAYTAQIVVSTNTPNKVDPVNVTMNVTPPKDWGKVAGTVMGVDCQGNAAPLRGVQVQATGNAFSISLTTDQDGKYAYWGPEKSNPYTLIASKDGWVSQSKQIKLKKERTETVNFNLQRVTC